MEWNKIRLIDFFFENFQKEIKIKELESSFSIQGIINHIEELEMCSYNIYEIQIIQKISENMIYIT